MAAENFGGRLKEVREALGISQDALARTARRFGISWTRSTVAKVEAGQRELKVTEWFALLQLLRVSGSDLVPKGLVRLSPQIAFHSSTLKKSLRSEQPAFITSPAQVHRDDEPGEAEQKAARLLGVTALDLLELARAEWGLSMSAERERRLSKEMKRRPKSAASTRTIQAIRGRISRGLIEELRRRKPTRKNVGPA
jgi:transcriptional regulator with XRE-family HTH domain